MKPASSSVRRRPFPATSAPAPGLSLNRYLHGHTGTSIEKTAIGIFSRGSRIKENMTYFLTRVQPAIGAMETKHPVQWNPESKAVFEIPAPFRHPRLADRLVA